MSRKPDSVDALDKEILNLIQSEFPIAHRPFKEVGERIGISEDEVIGRVERLRSSGVIRRIGGSFDSKRLGFHSTLCAAKVQPEKMALFNQVVNSYHGVTHNYTRNHDYNIWFTLIAETQEEIDRVLDEMARKTGVDEILSLPAKRTFKIRVKFEL